jgi:outer membrane protein assembly factor BamB
LVVAGATLVFAAPSAAQLSSAWSQFRDNAQGTSQGSVVGAQSARPASGFPVNLPVVPGGAGEAPGGVAVSASGTIFVGQGATMTAYSSSGRRLWTYSASGGGGSEPPTITAPALSLSGSTVYSLQTVFNFFGGTPPSTLIAVNAATGKLRWSAPVGTLAAVSGTAQPTVTVGPTGTLYVAANISSSGGPEGSALITGATVSAFSPYGGVEWSTAIGGPVEGGPVVDASGNVYVSNSGGPNPSQVVALNAGGSVLWQTTLGSYAAAGALLTPPVLSPGGSTVFVATRSTDQGGTNGSVYALSTADGSVLGTIGSASGGISGTLALSARYGYLYGGTSGGFLSALPSGGGNPVWAAGGFASSDNVNAPAIGADGTVYAATGPTLVAVAGATGATKWRFTAPIATGSLSSPSIGPNGNVYVTSQALGSGPSQLFAFEGPG